MSEEESVNLIDESISLEEDIFEDDDEEEDLSFESNLFKKMEPNETDDDNLKGNTRLIKLGSVDFKILLKLFRPTEHIYKNVISHCFQSVYKEKFLLKTILEWFLEDDDNDQRIVLENYHYKCTKNNAWFFVLMDNLPNRKRNAIMEKYFNNTFDETAKIDITNNLKLTDLRKKDYKKHDGYGIRVGDILTDMKKVIAHVDIEESMFIIKKLSKFNKRPALSFLKPGPFKTKLSSIKLGVSLHGSKKKEITAWNIYNENINVFTLDEVCFCSTDPNIFSIFQGYQYDLVEEVDLRIIQPYLDHIKNIISNHYHDVYLYILNWLAFLFQNPQTKVGTSLIITGPEGTGKTVFTNVICQLLGDYANENAKMDKITGKFNSSLLFKRLIVCNEVPSFFDRKKDNDNLKQLITETKVDVEAKFKDANHHENNADFIFVSNNFAPIQISETDRRFLVTEVSSEKRLNLSYFDNLVLQFNDTFYQHLLTFFMKYDTRNWNKENIPQTEAKKSIIEFSKSPYELFIRENVEKFKKGFVKCEAWEEYKKWCKNKDIINPSNQHNFRKELLNFCRDYKPASQTKNRPAYYILKPDAYVYFGIQPKVIEVE